MADSWVLEEMRTVDLKDTRLNYRLNEVLTQLSKHSAASIPAACGGHTEMTAAYRLFDNQNATLERILKPHSDATHDRIATQNTVLLAQDTTEIDVTRPTKQVHGAGPLAGPTRRGLFLHVLHAFTPNGTPLGTLNTKQWVREDGKSTKSLSRAQRAATPIEQKESHRWLNTLRKAQDVARNCSNTRIICLCDSEADIYELLSDSCQVDWIIRGCQNRALQRKKGDATTSYIHDSLLAQPVLYSQTINIRGRKIKIACDTRGRRQARKSRQACVEVRSACVSLRPPYRHDRKLPETTVNVVLVRELSPPRNEEPVEWLLLTSMPVENITQVREIIEFYSVRWMIEIFFRVLKSGCRVEERRFENINRLQSCLAVYMIIAWRTLYVCRLAREYPDENCEVIFNSAEWRSAWKVVYRDDPPSQPPTLSEMTLMVAQLGGYIKRKDSPPGPQTIWCGLRRIHDFALCWDIFGPDAKSDKKDV